MLRHLVPAVLTFSLASVGASAQPPESQPIEPDRPDVTNGTHIVDVGLLQLEVGAVVGRPVPTERTFGSPLTARVGLLDWIEARVGVDGLTIDTVNGTRAAGFGNLQLGAKLRLWASPGGVPVLSILPTINLPTSSTGLGSGQRDYTLGMLTGTDVGRHGHVDVNYGVGRIGTLQGSHFVQHLVSMSASAAVSDNWNPYAEVFRFSRQDLDTGPLTAVDLGAIYELGSRFALDGGVQVGVAGRAPDLAIFGGLSVIVGDVLGSHGVHARVRRSRDQAARGAERGSTK